MGTGFQNALERMLPPKVIHGKVFKPNVTTSDGVRQGFGVPRNGHTHDGVDINYHYESGNPLGPNGINKEHPDVCSPVSGTIVGKDEKQGMLVIKDANGFKHEIRHLDKFENLHKDDSVSAGQVIGKMGGRGPKGSDQYAQHVHYSIKSPNGKNIDPEKHWDNTASLGYSSPPSFPWDGKTDFLSASLLDRATQERLKSLSQGITIANGETLRREGDKVWRIEKDGGTRGYFIS